MEGICAVGQSVCAARSLERGKAEGKESDKGVSIYDVTTRECV